MRILNICQFDFFPKPQNHTNKNYWNKYKIDIEKYIYFLEYIWYTQTQIDEMFQKLYSEYRIWIKFSHNILRNQYIFDKLIDIVYKLQFIFKEFKSISEIDINPIFCDDEESIVIDAKFYL